MNAEPKQSTRVRNEESLISVSGLFHSFGEGETKRVVLHDINVDFYAGEIVIIMGPSGAGKTTLLTLAGALRSVQKGSVVVNGINIAAASLQKQITVRHGIGFIFQAHNLLESLTACENVQMGLAHLRDISVDEIRARSMSMLDRVGLSEHALKRPNHLSGGQRQRVAVARALVRKPSIIMADEPTAALDKHSGREIVELLQRLAREMRCAILMVTHDNRILDIADRILTLEDGNMEESHRGLERLSAALADAMHGIARYPAFFAADSREYESLIEQTVSLVADQRFQALSFVARRLCANLAREAKLLEECSEAVQLLEEDVRRFGALYSNRPGDSSRALTAPLFESLEFLLNTAAEAMTSRNEDDILHLLQLTENRGPLMESLRARHFDRDESGSRSVQDHYFDITNVFVRIVHFLRKLADILAALAGVSPAPKRK